MSHEDFHTVRGYQLLHQNEALTSAMEDYLEMIIRHSEKEGGLRINELAELLHVKASSATKMVQKLGALGFLQYEKYGIIILAQDGIDLGTTLLHRHRIIAEFLQTIGTGNLLKETELIEHNVSPHTLSNIDRLNRFFCENPDIAKQFENFKQT